VPSVADWPPARRRCGSQLTGGKDGGAGMKVLGVLGLPLLSLVGLRGLRGWALALCRDNSTRRRSC